MNDKNFFLLKEVTSKLHVFLTPLFYWLNVGDIVSDIYDLVYLSCSNKIPYIRWPMSERSLSLTIL